MLNTILAVAFGLAGLLMVAAVVIKLFFRERYRHMKLILGLQVHDKGEENE